MQTEELNNEIISFIGDNFPFLNPLKYLSCASTLPEWLSQEGKLMAASAIELELKERRNRDFQRLVNLSTEETELSSSLAREALFQIAINPSIIIGEEYCDVDIQGCLVRLSSRHKELQINAAETLVSQMQTGAVADTEIALLVVEGLCRSTNSRVRMEFLKGIHKLTAYEKESSSSGTNILLKIAEVEMSRSATEQDPEFQAAFVDSLVYFKMSTSLPVLRLLAESPLERISQQAQSMISLIQEAEGSRSNL